MRPGYEPPSASRISQKARQPVRVTFTILAPSADPSSRGLFDAVVGFGGNSTIPQEVVPAVVDFIRAVAVDQVTDPYEAIMSSLGSSLKLLDQTSVVIIYKHVLLPILLSSFFFVQWCLTQLQQQRRKSRRQSRARSAYIWIIFVHRKWISSFFALPLAVAHSPPSYNGITGRPLL